MSAKSVRSSRTRNFDEPRLKRKSVRYWVADSPFPLRRRSTPSLSGDYGRPLHRNSLQPLPYGRSPPPPYYPGNGIPRSGLRDPSRYRSRTVTPLDRRETRSSGPSFKSKKEKIKDAIEPFAAGGAGAIAGAYIGHAVGKGDMATTIVGAAIGAIGEMRRKSIWRRGKKGRKREKRNT